MSVGLAYYYTGKKEWSLDKYAAAQNL